MVDNVTRRDLLRRSAAATGAVAVGAVGLSGTAAASLDCPRTVDEWRDNYWAFHRSRDGFRLDRSEDSYDSDTAWELLGEDHDADKAVLLAKEVVAAQANVAAIRTGEGGDCADAADRIRETVQAAISWLDCSDGSCADGWDYLAAPEEYGYTYGWRDDRGVDGEPILEELRAFNRGRHCDGCGTGGDAGDSGAAANETEGSETTDEERWRPPDPPRWPPAVDESDD
jgi:hypothetical protein